MKSVVTVECPAGAGSFPYSEEAIPNIGVLDMARGLVSIDVRRVSGEIRTTRDRVAPGTRPVSTPYYRGVYEISWARIPQSLREEWKAVKGYGDHDAFKRKAVAATLRAAGFAAWQVEGVFRGAKSPAYTVPAAGQRATIAKDEHGRFIARDESGGFLMMAHTERELPGMIEDLRRAEYVVQ